MLAAPCSSLLHGEPRAAVGRQAEKHLGMGKESVNTQTYTLHRGSGWGRQGGSLLDATGSMVVSVALIELLFIASLCFVLLC